MRILLCNVSPGLFHILQVNLIETDLFKLLFCHLMDLKRLESKQNAGYNYQSKQITARNSNVARYLIMSRDTR